MWYLAYGSNVNPARFRKYLEGGETEPGARDPSPPTESRWFQLGFRLAFAGESRRWNGGGVAFAHPDERHTAWFRGWCISGEQFEDVFAQENRLPVGTELPWPDLHQAVAHLDVGESWYRRIHIVTEPHVDVDHPALTFSSPVVRPHNPPGPEYRKTIAEGLADHPELDEAGIEAYLGASSRGH